MITYLTTYKVLALLPILVLGIIIIRFYFKKRQALKEANKQSFDQTSFVIPKEENINISSTTPICNTNDTISCGKVKTPNNFNDIQHLSIKYNIGTYRNLKGQYESITRSYE